MPGRRARNSTRWQRREVAFTTWVWPSELYGGAHLLHNGPILSGPPSQWLLRRAIPIRSQPGAGVEGQVGPRELLRCELDANVGTIVPAIGDAGIEPTRSDCRKPTAVQIAVLVSSCREQTPRLLYEISGAPPRGMDQPPTHSERSRLYICWVRGRSATNRRSRKRPSRRKPSRCARRAERMFSGSISASMRWVWRVVKQWAKTAPTASCM